MYVAGDALNDRDPVLTKISDPEQRARVTVALKPGLGLEAGTFGGTFDMVLAV
jgi:hypothetical protein